MKTSRAVTKRHLPTSPFKAPEAPAPLEVFAVDDRVSHDKYGLGRVIGVDDSAVLVDFGPQKVRVPAPFSKLCKL
ncbi:hypothetical protein [Actinomadura macrotermitis]|uniref:Uncharacterized protein n=1 Tax=Actinomadura macrotermitis TaxID=2585200 RepID=A0A7K0BY77_9ACTN|nr:hypothetical protein [Actinomadura macrotermitis]MQY05812.1 hypothetical protein [Actinomadura macrotermitis]